MAKIKKVKKDSNEDQPISSNIMPKRAKIKLQKIKGDSTKDDSSSSVIRLSHIPYGFFEQELKGYFSQFGKIRRVRVLRNKKGNFNGIAFVQFAEIDVAEIAAETMDNYLFFENRMRCRVLKNKEVPKTIKTGKLYAKIPRKNGNIIKDAKIRSAVKTKFQEQHHMAKFVKSIRQKLRKIQESGIDYTFDIESKLQKSRLKSAAEIDSAKKEEEI